MEIMPRVFHGLSSYLLAAAGRAVGVWFVAFASYTKFEKVQHCTPPILYVGSFVVKVAGLCLAVAVSTAAKP